MACSWAHCRSVPMAACVLTLSSLGEKRSKGKRRVCMCVCERKFVCAAAALSKMPTLLLHSLYLFMSSLLSRVAVQGDHLQSHLHNDDNKVAPIGCVCVCVSVRVRSRTHDFTCSRRSSVHLHLLSSPRLDRSPSQTHRTPPPTALHPVPAPTHMAWHDPGGPPQTAGVQPTLTMHWMKR